MRQRIALQMASLSLAIGLVQASSVDHWRVSIKSNVRTPRPLSAHRLNLLFADGFLKNRGPEIISLANEHGLDPVFFAAVLAWETGWGKSDRARRHNNPAGLFVRGRFAKFKSLSRGLRFAASNLRKTYLSRGLERVDHIASVYAPIGINDGAQNNMHWPKGVVSLMNRFIQESTVADRRPNWVAMSGR